MVEISSFMGFLLRKFESDYSIFTNFKRDHQNWHSDLQDYLDAKMQVILRTKKKAFINEQVKDFAKGANLIFEIPQNASIFSS